MYLLNRKGGVSRVTTLSSRTIQNNVLNTCLHFRCVWRSCRVDTARIAKFFPEFHWRTTPWCERLRRTSYAVLTHNKVLYTFRSPSAPCDATRRGYAVSKFRGGNFTSHKSENWEFCDMRSRTLQFCESWLRKLPRHERSIGEPISPESKDIGDVWVVDES